MPLALFDEVEHEATGRDHNTFRIDFGKVDFQVRQRRRPIARLEPRRSRAAPLRCLVPIAPSGLPSSTNRPIRCACSAQDILSLGPKVDRLERRRLAVVTCTAQDAFTGHAMKDRLKRALGVAKGLVD